MLDATSWISDRRKLIDDALRATLDAMGGPPRLREASAYSVLAGGKRVRPLLVFAAAEAVGGAAREALGAAQAVELIHTFSLIHDDLPCMDDDDLRRGRPSCHKAFDEATALLAGDGLMSLAFELAASHCLPPATPERALRIVHELAAATGPTGMVGGQILDLAGEGQALGLDALEEIHALKTGALIGWCLEAAAIMARVPPEGRSGLRGYARDIGLAFQIADDLLDHEGSEEKAGKRVGKDAQAGKGTFVSLLGADRARQQARALVDQAIDHLRPFGAEADLLRAIARFAVERDH